MKYTLELKNLPFEPLRNQIIYVENGYDEVVNKFIQDNYEKICVYCSLRDYEFCYLSKLTEQPIDEEVLFYNAPYAKLREEPRPIGSDFLLQFMAHPENRELIPPSLLYLDATDRIISDSGVVTFNGMSVTEQDVYPHVEDIFFLRLKEIFWEKEEDEKSHDRIMFSKETSISYNKNLADLKFDEESKKIADEIRERIEKLEKKGVDWLALERYIKRKDEKLSRLHISYDYRIFLTDYNNLEIKMTPLPKALFLLFLSHPDGIPFKYLPDYKEELAKIYFELKPNVDPVVANRSIEDLTTPFGNSINEKCARVREAFIRHFAEHLAENYFITGKRGEPKKITLPRELVIWDK